MLEIRIGLLLFRGLLIRIRMGMVMLLQHMLKVLMALGIMVIRISVQFHEMGHLARNCTIRPRRRDAAYLQTHLLIAQKEETGIQLQAEEFDLMVAVVDLDEIEKVNANCILMANLQQASTSGTQSHKAPVYDSDGSAELSKEKATVSSLQEEKKRLKSDFKIRKEEFLDKHIQLKNKIKELDNILVKTEAAKFVRDFQSLAKEDESLAKHKALELEIERLLRAVVSQDIMSIVQSNSVVFEQKDTTKGLLKIDESHALSKPVTSNSVPIPQESKVVKNDKVIASGMFRIDPSKTSRKTIFVPKKAKAEVKKPKKVGSKERLASPTSSEPSITRRYPICLWCIDLGCSKHMTRNLKLLINFVWKFLGTVRFRNDHVAAILGFGDLQWGNILITRVYFVEGLGHNLFSVRQFCDSDLEVAFRRNTCFVSVGKYKLKDQSTAK
ncbi:hypothetical protein Tco_0337243 [Tanacetum coccineum]